MIKKYLLIITLFLVHFLSALENELMQLKHSLQQLHTALSIPPLAPAIKDFTFTLATCNVLYEPYYVQYLKKNNTLISIHDRRAAFRNSLHNDHALHDADILCFQEWPYSIGELRQNKNDTIFVNNRAITKNDYFNSIRFSYLKFIEDLADVYPISRYHYSYDLLAPYDTVLTIINKNKFHLLKSETIKLDATKRILVTFLQPNNQKTVIGVINAHLPYDAQKNFQALKTIKGLIAQNSDVFNWIICGDFNYDILDSQQHFYLDQARFNQLKSFFPHFNASVSLLAQPTQQGDYLPATAWGAHGYPEHDDYVFYSDAMKVLNRFLIPADSKTLLRHDNQDAIQNSYFSDHAILRIEFEL